MRFDTSQHMRMSQQMRLAPRMIQSMEILQMSLQELEERIEQELESNVTLETYEPEADPRAAAEVQREADQDDRDFQSELRVDEDGAVADFARLDSFANDNPDAIDTDDSPTRTRTEYEPGSYSPARMDGERDAKLDAMASTEARAVSLTQQLLEQWAFTEVDEETRALGRIIIEHIDDDGYMRVPLDEVRRTLPPNILPDSSAPITTEALERALTGVQLYIDPPGIGARDVRECLLLQVDALIESEPTNDLTKVRELIADHLDDLIHNRLPRVAQKTGFTLDEIKTAIEQMRRLSIHPGRALVSATPQTIFPDAIVEYDEEQDDYIVYLTDNRLPNLRLNREYARMAKDRAIPKNDREFLKTNISNAQWLIDAVEQRRQTLLRVLRVVVAAQRDVFDYGIEAVKPLPMTQVADQLGIHVATVSRAVAGKHLQTPRGIIPLRKLFTGGTQTDSGEEVSWDAIKAALREVVDNEDKSSPLSDDAIAKALKDKGLDIARRTVAKYRGQLDIPPARLRKQF
ncbi:MAG: RNA polymerase sigma-54 factor [Phycisphaeraceae bacterium]|nr:MAG: RNA polymerase sigma-54 factor [Phycisphaeraceae bacterium]